MLELTLPHKTGWASSLMFNCPIGKAKENCPLTKFRMFTFREREVMLSKLDETKIDTMLNVHKNCMKERGY